MGVYNVAIDTIFLCYCVDRERAGHNLHLRVDVAQKLIHSNGKYGEGVPVEGERQRGNRRRRRPRAVRGGG